MVEGYITVDGFCGGGGWSTGFEQAIGAPVTIGINHDADAIAMHKANHPMTKHYNENIWVVNPYEACQGRPVGWAHFSPDCKHFSRAKGAKPVNQNIRGLAWVVIKWAGMVHPDIISMENVPEFMTWGPCVALRGPHGRVMKKDGTEAKKGEYVPFKEQQLTPNKKKAGRTFREFIKIFEGLGYKIEWNELTACDYGAPTSRKRFFLLARRDGKPIVWPAPTHGSPGSPDVISGELKPYVTAGEIIDWNIECPSIFERKKPLAKNTLKRIARGIQKYIIDNSDPYIVHTASKDIAPTLIQYHTEQSEREHRGQGLNVPLQTVDAANRYGVVAATIKELKSECPSLEKKETTSHREEVKAFLIKYYSNGTPENLREPLDTITTRERFGLVEVHGNEYEITDIGLRMLSPRELYNAQGFPPDYEIETDCYGNKYPRKKQVARCGNSVPPPFATALVRANWPEACVDIPIETMQELHNAMAAGG